MSSPACRAERRRPAWASIGNSCVGDRDLAVYSQSQHEIETRFGSVRDKTQITVCGTHRSGEEGRVSSPARAAPSAERCVGEDRRLVAGACSMACSTLFVIWEWMGGSQALRQAPTTAMVLKTCVVTDLWIYGFTPLPPPPAGRPVHAHPRIKLPPGSGSR